MSDATPGEAGNSPVHDDSGSNPAAKSAAINGVDFKGAACKGAVPIEIAEGVYWVGSPVPHQGLDCNPYLLVDGDEGVLFDPGSRLDFNTVLRKTSSIVPVARLRLIVLSHEDPDLASSVPYFEQAGFSGLLAAYAKTLTFVQYYGVKSGCYHIEEHGLEWSFASGRRIRFIPTPGLHSVGAMASFDERTGTLFSGDIFGAFASNGALYSGEGHRESMASFHRLYMPSGAALRAVADTFAAIAPRLIAPQHGAVIAEDIPNALESLRHVECESEPLGAIGAATSGGTGPAGRANEERGAAAGSSSIETAAVDADLERIKDTLATDVLTGLRNQRVFWSFLKERYQEGSLADSSILYVQIDNLVEINSRYGRSAGDQALRGVAYIASNLSADRPGHAAFKLNTPIIAYFGPAPEIDSLADSFRGRVRSADLSLERLTVSIGLVRGREAAESGLPYADAFRLLDKAGLVRAATAARRGGDSVCSSTTDEEKTAFFARRVAIIDPDETHRLFLGARLAEQGYVMDFYPDGNAALEGIAKLRPNIIVSETMVPRTDGFGIRERLSTEARTSSVPFILVSHRKDDEYIRRAVSLRITHYLHKPYSMTELIGLVNTLAKEGQ